MNIDLERAATESKLRTDTNELRRLEIQADAMIADIRFTIDPDVDSVVELDTQKALILITELHKLKERAVAIAKKIKQYKRRLYG